MLEKSIKELHELLKNKQITPFDLYEEAAKNIALTNKDLNILLTTLKHDQKLNEIEINNVLAAIPYTLKDNINTKNIQTTAASKILDKHIPNYDANVYRLLQNVNATLMGKDNMDEFANGISTKSSYFGPTINPSWPNHLVGGSSGGSAAAIAANYAKFSIGTETGGSVRLPAAWNNIVGFKPTYGLISRYGVISFASSLDTLGIMAKTVEDISVVFDELNCKDERDLTSVDYPLNTQKTLNNDISKVKFGVLKDYQNLNINEDIKKAITKTVSLLQNVNEVSIKHSSETADIYYAIACVELFSNLQRFDGIRYSNQENKNKTWQEVITQTRNDFSLEVKKRICVGALMVNNDQNKELLKRAKIMRREMKNSLDKLFETNDIIIMPLTATLPPKLDEEITPEVLALTDQFTIISSLCGNPAISIPCGLNDQGLPVAIQLIAKNFNDDLLLNVAHILSQQINGGK